MARIDPLLALVQEKGASDLHLTSGSAPFVRIDGDIRNVEHRVIDHNVLDDLLKEIMSPGQLETYTERGDVDFGYEVPGVVRVRCNIFEQRRGISAAIRILPPRVSTLEELGLPGFLSRFAELNKGLVVVTGPPGSGKSTTQAALIDHVNHHHRKHIITIEDPIEYVHENHLSLIHQREVGRHTPSFAAALRSALREDPNILLVGEMRDLETISLAVTAAETGQLVFGTLHTSSAAQTVERLIDVFEGERQEQIRTLVSQSIVGVIAQRLLRKATGGLVAAVEVLIGTPAVRALIRERKTHQIPGIMQTGKKDGMIPLDDYLEILARNGQITMSEAQIYAVEKERFKVTTAKRKAA